MKIIKEIEELIADEIHDIKKYAELASKVKDEYPALAQVFYNISTQEDSHQAMLHAEVVKIIENYRKVNGDPPAAMMAVYEYVHKKHIENIAEARRYQEIYRNN